MAPTPSKSNHSQLKTPQSKRLNFNSTKVQPSPNPNLAFKDSQPEHPVEVIGRIRDYPDRKEKPQSVLHVDTEQNSVRVRADVGYRDFSLDGISQSEEEDLDSFYKKFVQSRINGVKVGDKCTIMMYGPTGSGKSHTMFGCSKQPGIVYRSLRDILGDECEENDSTSERVGLGTFVQVTVLEIYNEEIYDLLTNSSSNGGALGVGLPKGSASKVRLEVMGKKAKNATYMSGNEAGKISKEIQKVEKKRIVKSTLCNDRSSRSHCMIILDVPTVGGRLMLVDMAGSENIEQAGQGGFEAKMQTAKINQGNTALKRVVESIANGDSHVPFRDSKLTMLLQDSFEDDKSKILMILCASPDPKEMHKTISTLEYGAKAKCIVRGLGTMIKDKNGAEDSSSTVILGSRIQAMDEFIYKLQQDNKLIEKERNAAQKELLRKEKEIAELKVKLERMEGKSGSGKSEEEIISKVNEQTQILKLELEKKMERCQRIANDFVDLERRRMEEWLLQQQNGVEMLRRRLEEVEYELCRTRDANGDGIRSSVDGNRLARRLMGIYASGDGGMVKSMELDMDDQEPSCREIKLVGGGFYQPSDNGINGFLNKLNEAENDSLTPNFEDRVRLSTVFEEEEEEEKEVIEEKKVCTVVEDSSKITRNLDEDDRSEENSEASVGFTSNPRSSKEVKSFRKLKIQNIFTLCGNQRELSQQVRIPGRYRFENVVDPQFSPLKIIGEVENDVPMPEHNNDQIKTDTTEKPVVPVKEEEAAELKRQLSLSSDYKENYNPSSDYYKENYNPSSIGTTDEHIQVHVKWEDSKKENPGNTAITTTTTLKVLKTASLADLRKLIEIYVDADCEGFSFVDLSGGVIPREKEGASQAIVKLPSFDNHSNGFLACLRPVKHQQSPAAFDLPLASLPLSPIPVKHQQSPAAFDLPLASLPLSPIENISSRLMKDNSLPLSPLAYISVRRK